jgi:hypothetical protein
MVITEMMAVAGGRLTTRMVRTDFYIDAAGSREGTAKIEESNSYSSTVVGKSLFYVSTDQLSNSNGMHVLSPATFFFKFAVLFTVPSLRMPFSVLKLRKLRLQLCLLYLVCGCLFRPLNCENFSR